MSFYFDDEPQLDELDNDEQFTCLNCGGSDNYVDPLTGALCCTSCFTQSQQMTQESTELDVEEVQALAARTSSGRVMNQASRRKGGASATVQEKKPLQEYDTSTPFPNLITCIHGIQQVMKHCIESLCDLVGLSNEKEVVKETVQTLWMSYLRAWTDGAEFYGKLHPEIRFSLRDYFLPSQYKSKIMKHLSHKAAQVVRAELEANDEEKKEESSIALGDSDEEFEDDDIQSSVHTRLTKSHQQSIRHFSSTYHNPKSLMWMYWHKGKRGRMESALITPPSMNFVACLLWLAVSRAGVTLNHVLTWIATGAIPLQNAFKQCLLEQEQQTLMHVASFFRITQLPTLEQLETLTDKLVVACGLRDFASLHGLPEADDDAEAAKTDKPETVESGTGRSKPKASEVRKRPDFSYVTPRSVPLLTARLISDLDFGQEVLYRSLAFMGILREAPYHLWLPAPLEGALPKNLATTAQVLAVIATACRMTPGWETWVYPGPSALDKDNDASDHEEKRGAKRRRIESESRRFVPYNEENFRLLRNGPLVEGYLDFLEDNILDEKEAIFPRFRSTLESPGVEDTLWSTDTNESDNVVQKQPYLKESKDPFGGPERIWRRQKLHEWKLGVKRKRAQWADANGLGEYVIYDDPLTHANDRKRVGKKKIPIPEPFHPHYGLLIEYMSHKTGVKSAKIHAAITVLDDEILRIMGPKEKPKRKYTRRTPVAPAEASTETPVETNIPDAVSSLLNEAAAAPVAAGDTGGDGNTTAITMVEV